MFCFGHLSCFSPSFSISYFCFVVLVKFVEPPFLLDFKDLQRVKIKQELIPIYLEPKQFNQCIVLIVTVEGVQNGE